jgi:methylase of polypeptide subunit release factors
LAIMLATTFSAARIDAVDISHAALAVARRNVAAYRLQRRVRLLRSDMFSELQGERYDLIVANPPYVSASAMRNLPFTWLGAGEACVFMLGRRDLAGARAAAPRRASRAGAASRRR